MRVFSRSAGVCFLLWIFVPSFGTVSLRATVPPAPENLISPANKIDPTHLSPPWDAVIKTLQGQNNITASFTENRFLPFKKIPVVFTGELRLSHERGLSLQYTTPENRTMIVDSRGVLLRDGSGRSRELPSDPRATSATSALLHTMQFDLTQLSQQFDIFAVGDANTWHFAFEPKDEALAKMLNRLVVSGEGNQVKRIVMRKSALQSIETLVGDVHENVTFTPEETQRYFR